jgi:hypothetical protein
MKTIQKDSDKKQKLNFITWISLPQTATNLTLVGTGANPWFTPRAHQQAIATGPFGDTCEVDEVSPKAAMRGLQDRDVYNQGEYQVGLIQQQHNQSYIKYPLRSTPHNYRYDLTQQCNNNISIDREQSINHTHNTRYTWFTLSLGLRPQNCVL